jgi:hypothetical protein
VLESLPSGGIPPIASSYSWAPNRVNDFAFSLMDRAQVSGSQPKLTGIDNLCATFEFAIEWTRRKAPHSFVEHYQSWLNRRITHAA